MMAEIEYVTTLLNSYFSKKCQLYQPRPATLLFLHLAAVLAVGFQFHFLNEFSTILPGGRVV
jgi:hypothetical protein